MPNSVRVLFFASAREAVGRPKLERPLTEPDVSLTRLLDDLARDYPRLGPVLRVSRIALNGSYLEARGARVRPGDELAIHPPYSGG